MATSDSSKSRLFTVSPVSDSSAVKTRLIRARSAKQVIKLIASEALAKLRAELKVDAATPDKIHELGAARVKIEDIPE